MSNLKQSIKAIEIQAMRQAIVYGWYRQPNYLYIGKSNVGICRILAHDKIGVVEPLLEEDEIHIFTVDKDISLTEVELIQKYKPKYNFTYTHKEPMEVNCIKCGNKFWQNRAWQKYCSRQCSGSKSHYSSRAFQHIK